MEKSLQDEDNFVRGSVVAAIHEISATLASLAVIVDDLSRMPALQPFGLAVPDRE
jgi:hypothetical protein